MAPSASAQDSPPVFGPSVTPQATSITIAVDATPDAAQDFAFTGCSSGGCGGFSLDDDASPPLGNTTTSSSLAPGTYTVTQAPTAGWSLSQITCNTGEAVQLDQRRVTITLSADENVLCTFSDVELGSITIVEDARPNAAQDFSFTGCNPLACGAPFPLDDDADPPLANTVAYPGLPPATYSVTQATTPGWDLTDLTCSTGEATSVASRRATITLTAGEATTCTFSNDRRGSITLVADALPNDAQDFSFVGCNTLGCGGDLTLDDDADGAHPSSINYPDLPVGTYRITQAAVPGWDLSTLTCTTGESTDLGLRRATITLTAGEDTTCTFENAPTTAPHLTVDADYLTGLSIPWDVGWTPDGTMIFTERVGRLRVRLTDGTLRTLTADLSDLYATGETGLMGLAIDPDFATNRRIYTCQGQVSAGPTYDIQVVAWQVDLAYTTATRVNDPLVGGIEASPPNASPGRHGGCRPRFGPDGRLWIGTGDRAVGTLPQNLGSLNGKVLRVDEDTGLGVAGNPFFGDADPATDPRIYNWGHRNVQGLALRPGTSQVWEVEHGTDRDDEINLLAAGANYGWDPVPGYDESRPMTDFFKFPGAVPASWSSGNPTVATSGATFLQGAAWGPWEGALAVAALKDTSLRVFYFTGNGSLIDVEVPAALDGTFGRLRTPLQGPDGSLYLLTSNGGNADRIIRVTPG